MGQSQVRKAYYNCPVVGIALSMVIDDSLERKGRLRGLSETARSYDLDSMAKRALIATHAEPFQVK
jgi:hypothetical protein